jgi:hypothetical protein
MIECNDCRFFYPVPIVKKDGAEIHSGEGWCRRRPPVIIERSVYIRLAPPSDDPDGEWSDEITDEGTLYGRWPTVSESGWCGEGEAQP